MRTFTTFSRRLLVLAALGLAASACSSAAEEATEVAAAEVAATEVTAGSVVEGSSMTETAEVEVEPEAQAADATTSTTQAQQEEETTTTSVLSDRESDGLSERLAAYLLANPDGIEIDEAGAACSGDALASALPADRLELLVTNLEEFDELEDGRQFSAEERLSIAGAFATCLDFGVLVDEIVQDEPSLTPVVACIEAEGGIDRVEAVMLAGALGEDTSEPVDSLLAEALAVCPEVARAALAEVIGERMFVDDSAVVASCLDAFTDDEVASYLSGTSGVFTLMEQLEPTCFANR